MKKAFLFLLFVCMLFAFAYAESVTQWDYDLTINEYTFSGKYTGDILNGKPDGYGIYETITPDGISCHYIGYWKDGLMHGNGAMYWDDGSLEIGEFYNGNFVTGEYNYNGHRLLTAAKDDEETINPHWISITIRISTVEDESNSAILYIGNKNSHVFHRLDCDSIRTMKEKNKVEFFSREEAIEKKYKPCDRCKP